MGGDIYTAASNVAHNIDWSDRTANLTINLGGGADTFISGSGNDFVTPNNGADIINLGAGNDSIEYALEDTIDGDTGFDTIILQSDNLDLTPDVTKVSNVEQIFMNGNNNVVILTADDVEAITDADNDLWISTTGLANTVILNEDWVQGGLVTHPIGSNQFREYTRTATSGDTVTIYLEEDAYSVGYAHGFSAITTTSITSNDPTGSVYYEKSTYSGPHINIQGGAGDDHFTAGDRDDTIYTQGGNDTVYAGGGDDRINLNTGADLVYAGDGDDFIQIWDTTSAHTIYGENGSDTLIYKGLGSFDGGTDSGLDTVDIRTAGTTFDLSTTQFTNIEAISISTYAVPDNITADDVDLVTEAGKDTLKVRGSGTVYSTDDWTVQNFSNIDGTVYYHYTATATSGDTMTLSVQSGMDAFYNADVDGSYTAGELVGFESTGVNTYAAINDFDSAMNLSNDSNNLTVYNRRGENSIETGSGNDTIHTDVIYGTYNGGSGNDTLIFNGQSISTSMYGSYSNIENLTLNGVGITLNISASNIYGINASNSLNITSNASTNGINFTGSWSLDYEDASIVRFTSNDAAAPVYVNINKSGNYNEIISNITKQTSNQFLGASDKPAIFYKPDSGSSYLIFNESDGGFYATGSGTDSVWNKTGFITWDGGAGTDYLNYSQRGSGVNINLLTDTHTNGSSPSDKIDNVEWITGSNFNDVIYGENHNENFLGGNGNDTLMGGMGLDIIKGEGGNDIIYGSNATTNDNILDELYGGSGNDTIYFHYGDRLYGEGNFDKAILMSTVDTNINLGDEIYRTLELINIDGNHANSLIADQASIFTTTGGGNILYVNGGADDTLYLDEAWSKVTTTFYDGVMYDTYTFTGTTIHISQNIGSIKYSPDVDGVYSPGEIHGYTTSGIYTSINDFDSAINLFGSGSAPLNIDSGGGNDHIVTSSGNDFIRGGAGNDYIDGDTGEDDINGEAGDDTIVFNNDLISFFDGGSGTDTLLFDDFGLNIDFNIYNVDDIEIIDLADKGNTISFTIFDMQNMTEQGDDFEYTLIIKGGGSDVVNSLGQSWINTGPEAIDGQFYTKYETGLYNLLIDDDITMNIS
nr:calcium-binding protein [Pseudemcibacter aquimaris]